MANNVKRKNVFALIAALVLIVLIGCPIWNEPTEDGVAAGYGKLRIDLTGQGRTVFPNKAFDNYVYTFTKEGGAPQVLSPANGVFTLEVGNWTVKVDAYVGAVAPANLAASGTKTFTVVQNQTATVELILQAQESEGTGTFKYNIQYPSGAVVENITLEKLPDMTSVPLTATAGATSISETVGDVPAGFYLFTVLLEKDGKQAGKTTVVHIYHLLTSEYGTASNPIVFTETDFINIIPPPGAVTVNDVTLFVNETYNVRVTYDSNFAVGPITWPSSTANVNITPTANGAVLKAGAVPGTYTVTVQAEVADYMRPAIVSFTVRVISLPPAPAEWHDAGTTGLPASSNGARVAYGNGIFVVVGASGTIVYSTNGVIWKTVNTKPFTTDIRGIAFGGGNFVIVSNNGEVARSANGVDWTALSPNPFGQRLWVASDGGQKFAAGGTGGSISYSTDGGLTWTTNTTSAIGNVRGIAYGNGRLVAVGDGARIAYSDNDGATWTAATAPSGHTANYYQVAYGNGKFIVIGFSGIMAQSADGITWEAITTHGFAAGANINAITYNGYFVAATSTGVIRYSTDGTTWTAANPSFTGYISGIAYGSGRWVAANQAGNIGYSPEEIPLVPPDELNNINKHQFRAAWVSTVSNLDFARQSSEASFRTAFNNVLNTLVAWNMNAVIFQVRPMLDAWYPSTINPWSQYISSTNRQGTNPGYNPLQIAVEETHKRGLEFHAWFNPYRVNASEYTDSTVPGKTAAELDTMPNREAVDLLLAAYTANNTLAANNWAVLNPDKVYRFPATGYKRLFLDAGNPAVIQHVVDTIQEVIENYDVDAIHFDDYFYPYAASYAAMSPVDQLTFDTYGGAANGYGSTQAERERWWRDNNTKLITAVKAAIAEENLANGKAIQFGISPFGVWYRSPNHPAGSATGNTAYTYTGGVYADTRQWVLDEKVDYMLPQLYWARTHASAPYTVLVPWWAGVHTGKNVHLYIGHANYHQQDYFATDAAWADPTEILEQLKINDNLPEVKGSSFFRYNFLANYTNPSAGGANGNMAQSNQLVREHWNYQAIVPPKPWIMPTAPAAPLNATMTGKVITWNDTAGSNTRYYVIYRITTATPGSNDATLVIQDASKIIGKVWRNGQNHSFTDNAVEHPDQYTYIVTAANAAHVESAPAVVAKQ